MAIKTVKQTRWFPIFTAGTHTDAEGVTREWTEAALDKIVSTNFSRLDKVPAVVGHPTTSEPAYGWLGGLKKEVVNGTPTLFANLKDTVVEFYDAVKAGMYKHLSISLEPDLATLRHVGFLGAAAPAVEGLGAVQFAAGPSTNQVVEFAAVEDWQLKSVLRTFQQAFQRIRDFLVTKYDSETADKVITPDSLSWLANDIADVKVAGGAQFVAPASPSTKGEDPMDEKLKQENEQLKGQLAEFSKKAERVTALETENATLKSATEAAAKAQRTAQFSAFVSDLVKNGQLLPAAAPVVTGLCEVLHSVAPVQFSAEKTEAPLDALKALLSAYPQQISFSRVADKTAAGAPDNTNAVDIAARAVAFQKAQAAAGVEVTISQAVEHVTQSK